jgi:hypothetical protein
MKMARENSSSFGKLARQGGPAPGVGAGVDRAAQQRGPVCPGRPRSRGRRLVVFGACHQDGDQGRDLFRRGVAAYHPQERFSGGGIVVSRCVNHSPFSIKEFNRAVIRS